MSYSENTVIIGLIKDERPISEIARRIRKSRKAIRNFLNRESASSTSRKVGSPPKLTSADRRTIVRRARKGMMRSLQLISMYQPPAGVRRVQRIIAEAPQLDWTRMKLAPPKTKMHRKIVFLGFAKS